MRVAYADPPYPGQSAKHYRHHPDYAGEVNHADLVASLADYDGWILHTSSPSLHYVEGLIRYHLPDVAYRVCIWAKTFAAFKRNVPVAYAWEPVIIAPARAPTVEGAGQVMRDWIACPITLSRGVVGAKPDPVCRWAFDLAGLDAADDLVDLFPGSGAVDRAWRAWRSQLRLLG